MAKGITIAEAARRLGISQRMVWKIVAGNNLVVDHGSGRGHPATVSAAKIREYADALEVATLFDNPEMRTYGAYAPPKDDADERLFVRAAEAAQMLGLTRRRLMQITKAHDLAAYRIGRCVLLRPADVLGYKAYKAGAKPPRRVVPASVST